MEDVSRRIEDREARISQAEIGDGWALPEGWALRWPVVGIDMGNAEPPHGPAHRVLHGSASTP